ncbi:hypothetical protein CCR85_01670 [Rhodothalassium salexigens]|nr:hypothetical protein [Rhodothalassium salexigens]MBK5920842.1 hypothetical protein [Rhodothalassium salexigens]
MKATAMSDATAPPPPIDRTHFWSAVFNDHTLAGQILSAFIESGDESMASLRAADSYRAFKSAAHRLKGTARSVGARSLARQAELAELARDAPEGPRAMRALDALERHWLAARTDAGALAAGLS